MKDLVVKPDRSAQYWILGIVAASLLIRLVWACLVPVRPISDSFAYDSFAVSIASGKGYGWGDGTLTAFWPIGTPAIYAMLYKLFGHTYVPIVLLQALMGAVTVFMVMRLAYRWFGKYPAVIAGIILALWPSQIEFTTVLNSETVFIFAMFLGLTFWSAKNLPLALRLILIGVAFAGCAFIRPQGILLPCICLFSDVVQQRRVLRPIGQFLAIALVMALCILPWSFRNQRVFGRFVLISTNGGSNLWMGNNQNSTGGYMDLPAWTNGMNEAERDAALKTEALNYIRSHPWRFLRMSAARFVATFDRESIGVVWNPGISERFGVRVDRIVKIGSSAYWWLAGAMSLWGLWTWFRLKGFWAVVGNPLFLILLYFAAVHSIVVAQDRYHFPTIPSVAVFAGIGLTELYRKFCNRATNLAQPADTEQSL